MISFSKKYKPLFAKGYARDKVNSQDFRYLDSKEQEFWLKLDKVDTFIITGGRGSGKSIAVEMDSHIRGSELGHYTYYTRYTNDSLESTVKKDFEKILELAPVDCDFQTTQIKYPDSGLIVFKGLKRGSKAQTAGGKGISAYNVQVVEEAEEHPSFEEFDKMRLSLRRKDFANYSILLLNPTTKEHWIYKKFFKEKGVKEGSNTIVDNICYIHTSYLDVKKEYHTVENWRLYEKGREAYNYYSSLTQEEQEVQPQEVKRLYEWYRYVVLGGWKNKAEGVIFENWEIGEFDESLPYVFGQDYGANDPTTLIKVAIDNSVKKIYIHECFYKEGMKLQDTFNLSVKYTFDKESGGMKPIIADNQKQIIITLLNMLSVEEETQGKQLNIYPARKGGGSVVAGIKKLLGYTLVVTKESTNVITELDNYVWLDSKSDTPIDKFNHAIDSIRYAVDFLER